jgi:hypothetical protein
MLQYKNRSTKVSGVYLKGVMLQPDVGPDIHGAVLVVGGVSV